MPLFKNKEMAHILFKGGYVTNKDLSKAWKNVRHQHNNIEDYLLSKNLLTKDLLGQAIAEHYNVPYIDLNTSIPAKEEVLKIPKDIAQKYRVVLIKKKGKHATITTDNPKKRNLTNVIQDALKVTKITVGFSLPDDIQNVFSYYQKKLITRFAKIIEESTTIAPNLLNEIFKDATLFIASDIHFEPEEELVAIRFRIDGVLQEAGHLPKKFYNNILNKIKILAHLRIDEHDKIQDGGVRLELKDEVLNMRISIAPTIRGEKVVVRILSHYVKKLTFANLGLSEKNQRKIQKVSQKPFGMILTVGPTGSGKTTTLYSILKHLNTSEINITTIEDPVEYRIPGVNQIQVNEERDITFSKGLRSIIRQDPDTILVGEIRDKETVDISLNAALTGHLLLSTFHANDAASAIPRLLFMGAEAFVLSSTLELIIAQRLVRRICDKCKVSVDTPREEIKKLLPTKYLKYFRDKNTKLYKGKGEDSNKNVCPMCNGLGYHGRVAIFELIEVNRKIKELILQKPTSQEVWKVAKSQGAHNLLEDGIGKALEGITTVEEIIRVAKLEDSEISPKKHVKKK